MVERLAPRLAGPGYAGHLERLLRQATEGMAWQADHIRPVYQGGGLCDIDNMRTLCTACHAGETARGGVVGVYACVGLGRGAGVGPVARPNGTAQSQSPTGVQL